MRWWHEYVLEHAHKTVILTATGEETGLQATFRVRTCSCGRSWML